MATHGCTIIARNYIPYARILIESFFAHHSSGSFTVLVIDDEERAFTPHDSRVTWLRLRDVGLDPREIHRLAAIYDVTELATAVKPRLLRHLTQVSGDAVLYLDPDIRIYDALDGIASVAREHEVVLTPHTMRPFPKDGGQVNAFYVLAAGVYNLGFIGVGSRSADFLDWWWQVTRREALVDVAGMMFTDQRWVDLAPCLFDPYIFKDPGTNVAYWNLHGRELVHDGERYLVDGGPLRFFHFSGFNPKRPWLLSRHQGDQPRILLSDRPALERICREYASALEQAGIDAPVPYGWSRMACGISFDKRIRRLYWHGLKRAEQKGLAEPPDPFDDADRYAFVDWLNEPDQDGPRDVSRYLYAIYKERTDLQLHFPDLTGRDAHPFKQWIRFDGAAQTEIPVELLPALPAASERSRAEAPGPRTADGLNIAGYFRAELGIGEAARLLTQAAEAANLPYSTTTYGKTFSRQEHAFEDRRITGGHDVNIVCVNADSIEGFASQMGPDFFAGRHTVGYWFWELEEFPAAMHGAFSAVDEVWVASDFMAAAIRTPSAKPVFTMPLPVPIPRDTGTMTTERLGVEGRFMFLFVFDFLSIVERKNPSGLVRAFTQAFAPNDGPVLVLKTINGQLRQPALDRLRAEIHGRPDILLIDEYFTTQERDGLICLCDCYVSLHRSEGLGLVMAEAMAAGKPVIATGYSGNLQFMTPDNSYLVDYTMTSVPSGCAPYPEGTPWAEPNLDHAAQLMRQVFEDPARAETRGRRGQEDVLTRQSVEVSATALSHRVNRIRSARRSQRWSPGALGPPNASVWPQLEKLASPRSGADGRSFPRFRVALQRTLFRALRPYWFQQSEFNAELIRVVRQLTSALRREEQARLDLQREVQRLQEHIDASRLQADLETPLAQPDHVDVSICVVQYRNARQVRRVLDEVKRFTRSRRIFETIVIHNDDLMTPYDGCVNYHNRNQGRLAGGTNQALDLAKGQHFVYLCGNHTHIVSPDWLDVLVKGLGDGVIGGTLTRSDGRSHIQGGVFVARTETLKQVRYDAVKFPYSWMDQDMSDRLTQAGYDLTHIEGMMSVMGHLGDKNFKIYHSHS